MKMKQFQKVLLFLSLLAFNVFLICYIENEVQKRNCFSFEKGFQHLKAFDITTEQLEIFYKDVDYNLYDFIDVVTLYFGTDCVSSNSKELLSEKKYIFEHKKNEYEQLYPYMKAIFCDVKKFPVGLIHNIPKANYYYANSWHDPRTYDGERVHEGCDIIATYNQRDIYPILSATDGIVENIGWLKLGGYRIGIRSNHGAYYYYAHLAEYARDFQIGDTIKTGDLLGFMGDTGYSEVEGTTGNFAVHLHFGIYFNDEQGNEFAINPYPILYFVEQRQKGMFDEIR